MAGERPILVTGAAGFIGSHLVRALMLEHGAPTVCLDALTYGGDLELLTDLDPTFVHGDICDRALVRQLLREHRPRAIFHLAAETHVDRSIDAADAFVRTNVVGTFELLEAVRQSDLGDDFRFVHVSTDEVHGSLGETGLFTEASPLSPSSPYSASKAAADHLVCAYGKTHGLPAIVVRSCNNYGPRQFPEKLLPLCLLNALEGKPVPIYGDGKNVRDWIYVTDHVAALLLALERGTPGETYLIGARAERTNLEIVRALLEKAGAPLDLIQLVADRPGHDRRYAVDPSKAERELGFAPSVSLDEGLERTVAWYREHAAFCERVAHARQRRGLGRA